MVGGIWGQTRSYGDTYHWAFHDGTVGSLFVVSVFFPGGRKPGAGDKVAADISQPGGAELSGEGGRHRVFGRRTTLVPAAPGWEICSLNVARSTLV
jgi:hypothetical protein